MIDIKKLHKEKEKFNQIKVKTFSKILKRCIEDIEDANKQEDVYHIIYEIPEFLNGHPLYEIEDCAKFIKIELEKGGFNVTFIKPNNLFISWIELLK